MKSYLKPGMVLPVYLSWWAIIFGSSFLIKSFVLKEFYMLVFYLIVILITYSIYVFIPLIQLKDDFSKYLEVIHLKWNKKSLVLFILILFSFLLSIVLTIKINGNQSLEILNNFNYIVFLQPPLVEELIFRGIIPACLNKYSKVVQGGVSVILFSSLHVGNGLEAILFSAIIGLILYILKEQVKSIIPGMLIHYVVNSNVSIALIGMVIIGLCFEVYYFVSYFVKKKS